MRFRFPLTVGGAILFFATIILSSIGCEHDMQLTGQQQLGLQATLSSIQANIFTPKCVNAGCHPGGGAPANLSLAAGVARGNLVGVTSAYGGRLRVNPGNATTSVLYLKVIGDATVGGAQNRMPLGGAALSRAETDSIAAWINRGALNN